MRKSTICLLLCTAPLLASVKHKRDPSDLPHKEKEFADQLSVKQRRVYCRKFNHEQRELALKYARGRGKDACYTPDEAVIKVMEETGMPLAVKGQREIDPDYSQ